MIRILYGVLLLLLLLLLSFFAACRQRCSNQILDISAVKITPFDNSGFKPFSEIDQSGDTNRVSISAKVFGIYLSTTDSVVGGNIENVECIESMFRRKLRSVIITADKDFDSLHKKGTSLNDCFVITDSEYNVAKPINQAQSIIENGDFALLLLKKPVLDSIYKFSIIAVLSDSAIFDSKTKAVRFLP